MKPYIHIFNLLILVLILAVGSVTFLSLRENKTAQLTVGIVTAIAYAAWGILHHWVSGDLHRKVVVEYVLMSALP
jgi:hypothetical protein